MKLVTSTTVPTSTVCIVCGRKGATLADLEGEAFRAYYHRECATQAVLPPKEA